MKKLILLFFLGVSLQSCFNPSRNTPLTSYSPIFMERNMLDNSVILLSPRPIEEIAKIFQKENYLFISEKYKGVHLIDNSDPSKPINKGFLNAPGCVDMAVKDNVLYIDNAVDLVSVDLLFLKRGDLKITKRLKDVFAELSPPDAGRIPAKYNKENRPNKAVIIGWRKDQ